MKLRILSSAIQDLTDGFRFYEIQEEGLGGYFLESLFSDIDSLKLYAGIHSKVLMYLCAQKPLLLFIPKDNLAARIVEQNSVGFCVEPENIKDYLLRANDLYCDEKLRDKMAKNARNYAEVNFDIEKISFKFIEIFNTLVK